MNRRILAYIIGAVLLQVVLSAAPAFAQARINRLPGGVKLASSKRDVYGEMTYKVYYALDYVQDRSRPEIRTQGDCLLAVGPDATLFCDYSQYRADSLLATVGPEALAMVNTAVALSRDAVLKYSVVTLPKRGIALYQTSEVAFATYRYEQPLPELEWSLSTGKKEISGLECERAVVRFGGREWEAWFTRDLTIPYGPYMMYGLPGLILEMADHSGEYHFTFAGMERAAKGERITLSHTPRLQIKGREEVRHIIHNFMSHPGKVVEAKVGASQRDATTRRTKRPYNPIEVD